MNHKTIPNVEIDEGFDFSEHTWLALKEAEGMKLGNIEVAPHR